MNDRKHRVLFVDDDPMIIRGFQRTMDETCENWEVEFAGSGKEATLQLSKYPFDAIVTDMHMPGMDGIQLLEIVSHTAPGVIRFVLSGNTSDGQILKSTHLVHQMIPKPCEMEKIYDVVERACCLRDMLSAPQLLQLINSIKSLPSLPRLYKQLVEQLQSENTSSQDISNIIAQDAAMTAKILQLVNSAFFGLADNISSPQKAVTILGFNTIKSLVLGIQVFSEYLGKKNLPLSVEVVWEHSLHVSSLAVQIARQLNLSSQEREDARVSGILHDIGILLSFQIPNFFENVHFNQHGQIDIGSEYSFLGTSHAEMGGYLLGIWGLPNPIVEAVTFHHMPGAQVASKPGLLTALNVANGLVNMCQMEDDNKFDLFLDMEYIEKLHITPFLVEWASLARNLINNPIDNSI
ncbi:MAG: response regulator [Chloroflexota bacterium]